MKDTVFSSADILIPLFSNDKDKMEKWSVIACDQFTSEEEYWRKCRDIIGESPSTLDYILPEVYIGSDRENEMLSYIKQHCDKFNEGEMRLIKGMIYVKRRLPNGKIRRGIIGKLDLERYDYNKGSTSPIRATEETIISRIPSRGKIRAFSKIELPHILILVSDKTLFDTAESGAHDKLYDFELMQGGGHIEGYSIEEKGDSLARFSDAIEKYEKSHDGDVMYAVGDGNHSLAAAKAHWEKLKENGADENHPARYALCELTPLDDDSLEFEPIYRLLKNCDTKKFMKELHAITAHDNNLSQKITVVTKDGKEELAFISAAHPLTQGTLQKFIDEYIERNPETECDYIHGTEALEKLAGGENCVGFIFDGIDKSELFDYIKKYGTLPRKTFSMGEAESKRYYLEARNIKETLI